ncbi:MAG TPA: hypothetical protein VF763_05440 [Candidatus Limnocylindrales bacterium]
MGTFAAMPPGVKLFLAYGLALLAILGLSLRWVVDQAIDAPVSPIGVAWMALLAYTIFTVTLVLQRKHAARGLALGLTSLLIFPFGALAWFGLTGVASQVPATLFLLALAGLLFRGLTLPSARAFFVEP